MEDLCFNIKDAIFSYSLGKPVLKIDTLQIQRGKVYFIVGRSGIGKSTLIEALGLMSNTISNSSKLVDFYNSKKQKSNFTNIFNNIGEVIQIRKEEFSFIFQETNLMPNLTAGENLVLTTLVSDSDYAQVKAKAEYLLKKFHLDDTYTKKVQHLSGGQRQRIAFIRAFISDYTILFGDEPTGNLDPITGRIIMNDLKDEIINTNKTSIIVSHDINLATEIADQIIIISPTTADNFTFGHINDKSIFDKIGDEWYCENKRIDGNISDLLFKRLKDSYD